MLELSLWNKSDFNLKKIVLGSTAVHYAAGGDAETMATWLPGGGAIAIIGNFLVILSHVCQFLPAGWSLVRL